MASKKKRGCVSSRKSLQRQKETKKEDMAPKTLFQKIKATKTVKHVSLDDVVPSITPEKIPAFCPPAAVIPDVTPREREQWHLARKAETNMPWRDRIESMKRDGRLWYANGVWHRRGDADLEKQWVSSKIVELFNQGKIIKADGDWILSS